MADFTSLKTAIQNAIKQNGNEEITGNLLQDVLLAIVTTLGDGSINDLITALGSEATTRQQADGTLQQNINAEAQARSQADTTLQQNIDAEAQARQQGDSTLQGGINTAMQAINAINNAITNGCVYAGIATPSSTPASGKVFYLAFTAGTYTHFNSLEVPQGINILKNNGSTWLLDSFLGIDDAPTPNSNKLVKSGGVFNDIMTNGSAFDLTAYNNGTTYADLNAALTALNALPAAFKKGGMSMKYVQSSDNKYVQYRLMSDEFTTDTTQWAIADEGVYIENPEFIYVKTDKDDKILWAIKTDGDIYYGAGVPQQVIDYINERIAGFSLDEYEDIVSFLNGLEEGDKTLQQLLNEKVDKVSGKSLIDGDFASAQETVDNPEYMKATTDSNGKVLEAITRGGEKEINVPIRMPSGNIEFVGNPEWNKATVDSKGKIIEGIKKDGTKYIAKLESPTIDNITGGVDSRLFQQYPNGCTNIVITKGSGNKVSNVKYYEGEDVLRTDTFVYGINSITETRTINAQPEGIGSISIQTNLVNLSSVITYN